MADLNRFITGYETVKRAMRQMGLTPPVSAAGATDQITIQMWALLSQLGRDLLDKPWSILERTWEQAIQDPTKNYALPADFSAFTPMTGWNKDARIPLLGPMTSQQWALLQARQLGGTTLRLQYRISEDQVQFYWAPSDPQQIAIDYISRGWVRDATDPNTRRDYVENDGDIILLDPDMMVKGLKLYWRQEKGFDTTAYSIAFEAALTKALDDDHPGTDLNTGGQPTYPYLGYFNMPDTGYGS